ncbi:MAG: hypothetical protein Q9168_002078 [Polycauliona sp. 1 TL-2023]
MAPSKRQTRRLAAEKASIAIATATKNLTHHLSRLPYEILQQIFTHILTFPSPLTIIHGTLKESASRSRYSVEKILPLIPHIASGSSIFFSRNMFHIPSPCIIPEFLLCDGNTTARSGDSLSSLSLESPREYITQMQVSLVGIRDSSGWIDRYLRPLLACPQLQKLEITILVHYHIIECEDLWYQMREIALALGAKLGGDENLVVALERRGEKKRWMIADFERELRVGPPKWPDWEVIGSIVSREPPPPVVQRRESKLRLPGRTKKPRVKKVKQEKRRW